MLYRVTLAELDSARHTHTGGKWWEPVHRVVYDNIDAAMDAYDDAESGHETVIDLGNPQPSAAGVLCNLEMFGTATVKHSMLDTAPRRRVILEVGKTASSFKA